MTDKKQEWEIDSSKKYFSVETELITTDFRKPDTLVGQTLEGRFLIEKDLTDGGADEGGFGLVYLAKDMKLMGKQTVVKILQKAALKNEDVVRKFQHEKEALIRLDHPNIVRILDSGTLLDGNPFMVMEYIEGYSLRRKLRENKQLPFNFVAHIIESVTLALSVAHSKQILHRDIKPENIMLTPQDDGFDRVRLIDFGIARVENSQLAPATEIPRGIGTILYIAPEQLAGNLEQTPAVDIYSFAIVIYEMLTGKLPFQPQTMVDMFLLQEQGVQTLPSRLRTDLPPEAEKILLSALAFDAEKRPPNARQFGRELSEALRGDVADTNPILAKTAPLNFKSAENKPAALTESSFNNSIETDFHHPISIDAPQKKSSKIWIWASLGLFILAAISITVGLAVWKSGNEEIPKSTKSEALNAETPALREINYFLNVQKMRDGKPFEEPFKSSGQEVFENGYKFKLNFQADTDGFLYVFNEDKDANGSVIYNILYPTPKTNNGSAEITSKEQIETSNNTFSGSRGTEIVWLIWTKEKSDDVETARQAAFDTNGTVKDEKNARQLTDFLQKYKNEKNETTKDTANQQTVVKGKGETIVQKIELEHR